MVVIIASVSLALVVCAIIPLIFCLHWRSSSGEAFTNVHVHTGVLTCACKSELQSWRFFNEALLDAFRG